MHESLRLHPMKYYYDYSDILHTKSRAGPPNEAGPSPAVDVSKKLEDLLDDQPVIVKSNSFSATMTHPNLNELENWQLLAD